MFDIDVGQVNDGRRANLRTVTLHLSDRNMRAVSYNDIHDPDNGRYDALRNEIEDKFDDVVALAVQQLNPSGTDEMAVYIHGEEADTSTPLDVSTPFVPWHDLTGGLMLNTMEEATTLNSNQSFKLDIEFVFTVRVHNRLALQGRGKWKGDFSSFVKSKKSIVQIHYQGDDTVEYKDCFWQFLALGLSDLLGKGDVIDLSHWEDCPLNVQLYARKLKSRHDRGMQRHIIGEAIKIHLGVQGEDWFQNEALLHQIETQFGVRIVLFSFENQCITVYPKEVELPAPDIKPTLFGLVSNLREGVYTHIDYIVDPHNLHSHNADHRMCYHCFNLYTRSRQCANEDCAGSHSFRCVFCHVCPSLCRSCLTKECGYAIPDPEDEMLAHQFGIQCEACHIPFYSYRCQELHVCREFMKRFCPDCHKTEHRGLLCGQFYCPHCSAKIYPEEQIQHKCFLKRETLKKKEFHYWAYDFESCTNEQKHHIPYLCTVWSIYPHPNLEALQRKYPHQFVQGIDTPVFVFWGLGDPDQETGVYEFFKFVCDDLVTKSHFFAHNAGKYDSIFIDHHMSSHRHLIGHKLQRGLKILYLHYDNLGVTFKDSLNFIPTSLRAMSKDFGIEEVAKGFFPHKILTEEYMKQAAQTQFLVARPGREAFAHDFNPYSSGQSEKKEMEEFLREFCNNPAPWNLKQDAISYCISDTVLLGMVLRTLREKTMELTCSIEGVDSDMEFDALAFVTGTSAIMGFYMSQLLPEETISIIDRYTSLCERISTEWFLYVTRSKTNTHVQFQWEHVNIAGHIGMQTVYKYLPCYDYGCKKCYPHVSRNHRKRKFFHECYSDYLTEVQFLRMYFVEVICIWEHEWRDQLKQLDVFVWFKNHPQVLARYLPLDPRDAYKGGLTELYKIRVNQNIEMADFVSEYPSILLGETQNPLNDSTLEWFMPIGSSTRHYRPQNYSLEGKIGVIKCHVLPPDQLYAPFLGYNVASQIASGSHEVLYGLCRLCMESRSTQMCEHTPSQRAFIGTWCIMEIQYALRLGYRLIEVIDVWEYEQGTTELFRNFIVPFMITKITSKRSGLVDASGQFTAVGQQLVDDVLLHTGIQLTEDKFTDSPALRTISKYWMNSFYGKWGQRSVWPETLSIILKEESDYAKVRNLLDSSDIDLKFAQVQRHGDHMIAILDYSKKLATSKVQKNDHIAAHVTAAGREMLHRILHALQQDVIYCDTDSIFNIKHGAPVYRTGYWFGDLELELPLASNWCGNGRKSYVYQKPNGQVIVKQKGIALKESMVQQFAPERLYQMIQSTYAKYQELMESSDNDRESVLKYIRTNPDAIPATTVQQVQFKTVRDGVLQSRKETVACEKRTTFLIHGLKRVPQWSDMSEDFLDTLPYGWKNHS